MPCGATLTMSADLALASLWPWALVLFSQRGTSKLSNA